jgi:RNA polymerase sigma factor (sigma-70 family)
VAPARHGLEVAGTGPRSFTDLVERAKRNDSEAWEQLVDRLGGLVWSVTQSFGLADHDAVDVGQMAWLQLAREIGHLRDPERIGLWLATTTRRECLRFVRQRARVQPVDPADIPDGGDLEPEIGDLVVRRELARELWAALDRLPWACRALLRAFLATPEPSYEEVAAALGVPLGSIGPRRQRCLRHLRALIC